MLVLPVVVPPPSGVPDADHAVKGVIQLECVSLILSYPLLRARGSACIGTNFGTFLLAVDLDRQIIGCDFRDTNVIVVGHSPCFVTVFDC